ncbi:hypothetical protein O6H91_23G066900 [Diphasiastrum complanatum]|nr:hypothetical protein O6H91_23G066900 [Diphasiastrum complanatum]
MQYTSARLSLSALNSPAKDVLRTESICIENLEGPISQEEYNTAEVQIECTMKNSQTIDSNGFFTVTVSSGNNNQESKELKFKRSTEDVRAPPGPEDLITVVHKEVGFSTVPNFNAMKDITSDHNPASFKHPMMGESQFKAQAPKDTSNGGCHLLVHKSKVQIENDVKSVKTSQNRSVPEIIDPLWVPKTGLVSKSLNMESKSLAIWNAGLSFDAKPLHTLNIPDKSSNLPDGSMAGSGGKHVAGKVTRDEFEGGTLLPQSVSPRSVRCIYRRNSAVGWFPRSKTTSYLERKIRMLQEKAGINASLDETLGNANLHLSRIEREKRAAAAAAHEAMETRKTALIEASWCRILKAAGIPYMSAALELQKAEKKASEALAAAAAVGVILRMNPRSPRISTETETFTGTQGSSHTITASLETAFEVDKEVAAAVKAALILHDGHNSDMINIDAVKMNFPDQFPDQFSERSLYERVLKKSFKDEFSQNNENLDGKFGEDCNKERISDSDGGIRKVLPEERNITFSDLREVKDNKDNGSPPEAEHCVEMGVVDASIQSFQVLKARSIRLTCSETEFKNLSQEMEDEVLMEPGKFDNKRTTWSQASLESHGSIEVCHYQDHAAAVALSEENDKLLEPLVTLMLERVKGLQLDQLSSLVTIVATRGLSALLKEENFEQELSAKNDKGGLGDVLVKHVSKLEAEKAAAAAKAAAMTRVETSGDSKKKGVMSESFPDLGNVLVKRLSKLEREKQAAQELARASHVAPKKAFIEEVSDGQSNQSLGNVLVKHMSKLEKEKQALNNLQTSFENKTKIQTESSFRSMDNERNQSQWKEGLDKVLVKHMSRLEKEKLQAAAQREVPCTNKKHNSSNDLGLRSKSSDRQGEEKKNRVQCEDSLDKLLVKHISRLEKEKLHAAAQKELPCTDASSNDQELLKSLDRELDEKKKRDQHEDGLEKVVKRMSKLEEEKLQATAERNSKCLQMPKVPNGTKQLVSELNLLNGSLQTLSSPSKGTSERACVESKVISLKTSQVTKDVEFSQAMLCEKSWVNPTCETDGSEWDTKSCFEAALTCTQPCTGFSVSANTPRTRFPELNQASSGKSWPLVTVSSQSEHNSHAVQNNSLPLNQVGIRKLSKLEIEKQEAAALAAAGQDPWLRRKSSQLQETQDVWGGLSLGCAMKRHVSKLELEQAAWRSAEEEARKRGSHLH